MNMFQHKISKELTEKLPHTTEYAPSRKYEGALTEIDEVTSHKFVKIIIDCEISKNDCTQIFNDVFQVVRQNWYFKNSKYFIFLWKEGTYTSVSSMSASVKRLVELFAKVDTYNTVSGDWENFRELYTPHRKSGQVILITTARKVAQLGVGNNIRGKNLLVLFPLDNVVNNINPKVGVTCIGYEKENLNTTVGKNDCVKKETINAIGDKTVYSNDELEGFIKISKLQDELSSINVKDNPGTVRETARVLDLNIEDNSGAGSPFIDSSSTVKPDFSGTVKEMLQDACLLDDNNLIPLQNIDNIIAQDGANIQSSNHPWYNTIPFGTKSSTYAFDANNRTFPRLLAICRGETTLPSILRKIKEQCPKIVEEYPDKTKSDFNKIVVLLTDKWDTSKFEKYDKVFLNHALQDDFRFIILLVTAYGYTQIPFLPNNRNELDKFSNVIVEDDFTINDLKNLLTSFESFEYEYYDRTRKQLAPKTYIFHLEFMKWDKIPDFEFIESGRIREKALLKFIKNVLWIKDSLESRIESKSIKQDKDSSIYVLHIFGKEVSWHPVSKDEDKLFGELTESMEEFMEKCDKKWRE
ncbi:MAG: hypothetical protein MR853_02320 [Selenomonadales bacterium]|nr:hypothetical protein [Selenomonadales bacterium]